MRRRRLQNCFSTPLSCYSHRTYDFPICLVHLVGKMHFQATLRRLVYIMVKELSTCAEHVFVASNTLCKDMNSTNDMYKANSIRALRKITDVCMDARSFLFPPTFFSPQCWALLSDIWRRQLLTSLTLFPLLQSSPGFTCP